MRVNRGLLGGTASAVAWGFAKQFDQAERLSRLRQRARAIQVWDAEGGRTPDQPTPQAVRSAVSE